jgi:tetratricopeptide (TPR) repeat protein
MGKEWPAGEPLPPETEQRVQALAHFATGVSNDLNNEGKEATDEFLEAALEDLDQEDLVVDVSRRLVREQRTQEAIDLLTKATARPHPSGGYFTWLGIAYLQAGQTNLAVEASQTAIKKAPENLGAYQNLSQLYLQTGRTNDAIAVIHRAASQTNCSPEFLLGVVDLLGRYDRQALVPEEQSKAEILKLLDLAAAKKPENPLIQQRLADLYLLQGEIEKAQPLYEQIYEKYPEAPGIREKLANLYIRTDKNEKAAQLLEKIRRDNPTDPSTYFFLGSISAESKQFDKAADFYETALKLNPEFELVYYDLAGIQIAQQKPELALKTLDKARTKFKLNFILEFYTGIANAALEKYSEALSYFTSAELLAKTADPARLNHVFYFQLGSTYERAGNIPEAVKAFRKCLELSPDYVEALNYLGYMWAERGENLEEAREMIERALKKEPENAAFLDSLGWVYYRLKRPGEALNYLNSAIAHSEKPDPTLFDHLGDVHVELKEIEKAREAYSRSLALKPDEKVKQKLDALGIR